MQRRDARGLHRGSRRHRQRQSTLNVGLRSRRAQATASSTCIMTRLQPCTAARALRARCTPMRSGQSRCTYTHAARVHRCIFHASVSGPFRDRRETRSPLSSRLAPEKGLERVVTECVRESATNVTFFFYFFLFLSFFLPLHIARQGNPSPPFPSAYFTPGVISRYPRAHFYGAQIATVATAPSQTTAQLAVGSAFVEDI